MPRVRALKEVRYAGVNRVPKSDSEEFDVSEKDGILLSRIGKVEYVKEEGESNQVRKGRISTKAQNPTTATTAPATGKKPAVTTVQPQENPVPQPRPDPAAASAPESDSSAKEPQPQSAMSTADVPNRGTYETRDLKADGDR